VQVEAPSGSNATPAASDVPPPNGEPHSNAEPLVAPVGPVNAKPLPSVDKPADAPQQINEVQPGNSAQVNTGANASGKPNKKKKAPYDKKDESSSKHKKKTGLDKLNPF
jgi:outer membrane protein assembly factor BamD